MCGKICIDKIFAVTSNLFSNVIYVILKKTPGESISNNHLNYPNVVCLLSQ